MEQEASTNKNTKKGFKNTKECVLFRLPVEILGIVICSLDSKTAFSLSKTCKYFTSLMHTDGSEGRKIWSALRQREGWPDPTAIGKTDYQFFRRLNGRGCDFCTSSPRTRTPKWEFGGVRMCKLCLPENTIRSYQLDDENARRCALVPSIKVNTWYSWNTITYQLYLKDAIPDHDLTAEEEIQMYVRLRATENFVRDFDSVISAQRDRNRITRMRFRQQRKSEIDKFTAEKFPHVCPYVYGSMDTYLRAIGRQTLFAGRSQGVYARSFAKELEQYSDKKYLHAKQILGLYRQLYLDRRESGVWYGKLKKTNDYNNLINSTTLPTIADVKQMCVNYERTIR